MDRDEILEIYNNGPESPTPSSNYSPCIKSIDELAEQEIIKKLTCWQVESIVTPPLKKFNY